MDRLGRYLEENQPFIDSVFSTVQDGIFILDRDDTIVRANAWMESKYTLKMPPALRKCYRVIRDRQTACPTCQQRSSRKDPQAHVEILPYPSAHAPTGWFEVSLSQLQDVDGTVVGAIGHVKDVTDRNQAVALRKEEINRRGIVSLSPKPSEPPGCAVQEFAGPIVLLANVVAFECVNIEEEGLCRYSPRRRKASCTRASLLSWRL